MLDDGQTTWHMLSQRVAALIRRWDDGGTPPRLMDFVPAGNPSLRRFVLNELVKVDLARRWSRRLPRRLEDYLAEFPELAGPSGVPCDLILEEYRQRRRAGEDVTPKEYTDRFPGQATQLTRLLS